MAGVGAMHVSGFSNVKELIVKNGMFVFLLVIAMSPLGLAAEEEPRNSAAGIGVLSCKDWKEGRSLKTSNIDNVFASWIQGYMSAMNIEKLAAGETTVAIPKMPDLLAHVDAACEAESSKIIFIIVRNYYAELRGVK